MPKTIQSCLSSQVLEQIERNDVSPDELITIEEHVSECPRCRELFDSHYTSSQWSELIQPALSDAQVSLTSVNEDGVDHSAAILKLLGPTDDPNMLGRIGNYEIVGVIGQGGMGAVFKGFDRSLNRFVAIKMLLPHLAASGAARKRFAREGQAVAAVVDDHVMAIHCVDQWQGIPYLVMTYSRGVSLQKRLNESGPLELREILRIGMQAAKGLAAAHAQGIVHRDIKPSNILLDQNVERVQLVDFGLARAVDDASLTCSGTLAGTPQYMSPEQARAETVDHRSDLFSLGSVLYAMCAGYAPFRADSSYSVLRLIIEKEPRSIREINSDIPDWLCAIIGKLMAKQAIDRFDSAKQVADLLEACLAHVQQPTTVPLPSSIADLALLGSSTTEFNQPQQAPTSDPKAKTWRRFIGPPIAKYLAAALAAAAMFLAGVVVVLELDKGTLTIKSVADNVPIRIMQGKDTVQELTVSKHGTTTRLRAGTYTVEIEADSTAYEIQGDNVTVKRGEETLVNISIGPGNENTVDGIQWSTYGDNDGLLSGARLILPDGGVYPGQPVAVEYRLKNVSTETKKLTVYIRGNREHITIGKDNRITDAGIATADEPTEITIEPGKEYVATSHRASIETHGLAPGVYQVALGSAFFYPDKADSSSKHEIPHRGSISFEILQPDAKISRPLSQDIHWGKSVSGLRLGAKFRSKSNNFAIGSIVEADLWIANDTKEAIECSVLLPHPMDGWLFNIENNLGSTIMLERPPLVSIYHPQEFFAIRVRPGEARQITGERIEGQPDKFAGGCAKFEIVNLAEKQGWADHTIKGRLVTQGGNYSAIFNVTLQRPDIPKIRIELDSGNCPFTIGKPDSDSTGAVDRFNKDTSSNVGPQSDSLEGVWEAIHYGQGEVPADDKRLRVIVTNGKIAALTGKRLHWISDYTLESQYVPKRISYEHDGKPQRGIYEVKDDGLRLNIADLTDALPTKFGTNHPEFKRLEGAQARELVEIVLSAAREFVSVKQGDKDLKGTSSTQTKGKAERVINGWPVPDTLEMPSFPKELHGNWRIQNATTLTTQQTEYIDQVAVIDQNTVLLPSSGQGTLYRLSHWKHRDDNQSIEVDLSTDSTDGKDSKTYQCLLEIHSDELILLKQQNERFSRPKSVDDISTSITRFTLVREKSANNPMIYSPLEAIEVAKRFANVDHGKSIGVKFRVKSVHSPFVPGEEADRGHTKSELHLDFRPLPANFKDDQFLVVLTPEAIAQMNKLGISDIEKHFLDKEVEVQGRVLGTMYTARGMPGEHFHLIVSDLQQIAFSKE